MIGLKNKTIIKKNIYISIYLKSYCKKEYFYYNIYFSFRLISFILYLLNNKNKNKKFFDLI